MEDEGPILKLHRLNVSYLLGMHYMPRFVNIKPITIADLYLGLLTYRLDLYLLFIQRYFGRSFSTNRRSFVLSKSLICVNLLAGRKYKTLTQFCFIAGPSSGTLAQHYNRKWIDVSCLPRYVINCYTAPLLSSKKSIRAPGAQPVIW